MQYAKINRSYPKGTYKFEITTKTKRIRELYFILGVYVMIVSIGTGSFAYIARNKSSENKKDASAINIIERIEEDLDEFKEKPHTADDIEIKMRHLTNLRDKSLITEEEYNKLVNQVFEKS